MTNQTSEILIYDSTEHCMNGYPLNQLTPKLEFNAPGSFCWRGYRGTWEIKNSKLYLIDLIAWKNKTQSRRLVPQIRIGEDSEFYMGQREEFDLLNLSLKDVFPKSSAEGVFAEWFNGELSIPLEIDGKRQILVLNFHKGICLNKEITFRHEGI